MPAPARRQSRRAGVPADHRGEPAVTGANGRRYDARSRLALAAHVTGHRRAVFTADRAASFLASMTSSRPTAHGWQSLTAGFPPCGRARRETSVSTIDHGPDSPPTPPRLEPPEHSQSLLAVIAAAPSMTRSSCQARTANQPAQEQCEDYPHVRDGLQQDVGEPSWACVAAPITRICTFTGFQDSIVRPRRSAGRRAFSANLSITQCDAVSRHSLMPTVGAMRRDRPCAQARRASGLATSRRSSSPESVVRFRLQSHS